MSKLKVPIVSVVIGEGASGGALGIGVCDRMLMFENTWYSVISPEGCASILWRDASKAPEAADSMKVTAQDLVEMGICDKILKEPLGGAHRDPESIAADIKHSIMKNLKSFENFSKDEIYDHRKAKFLQIGRDQGFSKSTNLDGGGLSYKESTLQKFTSHIDKNKLVYGGLGLLVAVSLIALLF